MTQKRIIIPKKDPPKGSVYLDVRGDKSFISAKGLRILTGRKVKGKNETIIFSVDCRWIVPPSCEIYNLRKIREQIEAQTGRTLEELIKLTPDEYRALRDGKPIKVKPVLSSPEYIEEFETVDDNDIFKAFRGE